MKCVLYDAQRRFVGYTVAPDGTGLLVRDLRHYLCTSEAAPGTWLFQEFAVETLAGLVATL